jgi:DNA-binding CsgD family transcriptional regulator
MKNSLNPSVAAVGLPEREVAERLGISEHTVRTQVVRGIALTPAGQRETVLRKDF